MANEPVSTCPMGSGQRESPLDLLQEFAEISEEITKLIEDQLVAAEHSHDTHNRRYDHFVDLLTQWTDWSDRADACLTAAE